MSVEVSVEWSCGEVEVSVGVELWGGGGECGGGVVGRWR